MVKEVPKAEIYHYYQNFNFIVKYLHTFRYRWINTVFKALEKKNSFSMPIKVVDIGCGTGNLYKFLNNQNYKIDYIGIEPTENFYNYCLDNYGANENFTLIRGNAEDHLNDIDDVDIYVALETFEHIPEYVVPYLLKLMADKKPKLLACSVPIEIGPAIIIKNVGSKIMGYLRYKEYKWIETFWAGIYRLDKIPPHGTKHIGFDWRWLKHNIRQNFKITSIKTSPISIIPASFAPSICFTAKPY
tara:strand:- start:54184 stop:54915 length:732 start_codon:yes stop_codon:yes gene_type:complete